MQHRYQERERERLVSSWYFCVFVLLLCDCSTGISPGILCDSFLLSHFRPESYIQRNLLQQAVSLLQLSLQARVQLLFCGALADTNAHKVNDAPHARHKNVPPVLSSNMRTLTISRVHAGCTLENARYRERERESGEGKKKQVNMEDGTGWVGWLPSTGEQKVSSNLAVN